MPGTRETDNPKEYIIAGTEKPKIIKRGSFRDAGNEKAKRNRARFRRHPRRDEVLNGLCSTAAQACAAWGSREDQHGLDKEAARMGEEE